MKRKIDPFLAGIVAIELVAICAFIYITITRG